MPSRSASSAQPCRSSAGTVSTAMPSAPVTARRRAQAHGGALDAARPCRSRRSRARSRAASHPAPQSCAPAAPRASAGSSPELLQLAPEPRYPLAVAQPAPGAERPGRSAGAGRARRCGRPCRPSRRGPSRARRRPSVTYSPDASRGRLPQLPVVAERRACRRVAASTDSGVAAATRQRRCPTLTVRFLSRDVASAPRSTRSLPTTITSTVAAAAGRRRGAAATATMISASRLIARGTSPGLRRRRG